MGNRAGSVRKLDGDSDSEDSQFVKRSNNRKTAQTSKGYDTEPINRRRSSGGNGESSSMPAVGPNKKKSNSLLTEHQKQVVIRSWKAQINRHSVENIGVRTFLNVFETSPEIKRMFGFEKGATSDSLLFDKRFQRQAKAFVRVVDEAVKDIELLEDDVQKRLHALGARHTKFRSAGGVVALKMQHWDTFAESMLETIIQSQRGMQKYRDTAATWRIFISWIIGIMKQGYYEALRAERRATTAGLPHTAIDSSFATPTPAVRGISCISAPGITSGSGYLSPYSSRNHSVCYSTKDGDLLQQDPQPPRSPLPAMHYSHFLEPSTAMSRSAPHSPYAVNKTSSNHYPSKWSQSTNRQYDECFGRGFVTDEGSSSLQVVVPVRGNEATNRSGRTYQSYKYEINEDQDYETQMQDENHPIRHYCSDYY